MTRPATQRLMLPPLTILALLICGVVWLPLRAWVWGRFAAPGERRMVDVFSKVMDIALSPPGGDDHGEAVERASRFGVPPARRPPGTQHGWGFEVPY